MIPTLLLISRSVRVEDDPLWIGVRWGVVPAFGGAPACGPGREARVSPNVPFAGSVLYLVMDALARVSACPSLRRTRFLRPPAPRARLAEE